MKEIDISESNKLSNSKRTVLGNILPIKAEVNQPVVLRPATAPSTQIISDESMNVLKDANQPHSGDWLSKLRKSLGRSRRDKSADILSIEPPQQEVCWKKHEKFISIHYSLLVLKHWKQIVIHWWINPHFNPILGYRRRCRCPDESG